jgi:radial spoke head protein 4A
MQFKDPQTDKNLNN